MPGRALIIIGNPGATSFSHGMADAASLALTQRGYLLVRHDLYAEGFNPVQPTGELANTTSRDPLVEEHCADLVAADVIVLAHPNWWGQPPAIMKGWIDRVLRLGTAYGYPPDTGPQGVPVGLLKAKCAFVFNSSNTPPERELERFGDPLDAIWRRCVFPLCGVSEVHRRMFGPIGGSTDDARREWLAEVRALVDRHTPPH